MKSEDVKKLFIDEYFNGNRKEYLRARRDDYCRVQLEFSCFIDSLCRDGEITQKQYDNICLP